MKQPWPQLKFWNTGEYQVIQEKLDDQLHAGIVINPDRKSIFASLRYLPMASCKAILLGQDPYPDHSLATGMAYSIPETIPRTRWPPTLVNILKEYKEDLGYPEPPHGSLVKWAEQGVLLWNAIPTCEAGRSLSHDWDEWTYLTKEVLETTTAQGVVVVLMGSKAQQYDRWIKPASVIINTSHPSPLAYMGGRIPRNSFLGSKVFSHVNIELVKLGKEPINWRLDNGADLTHVSERDTSSPEPTPSGQAQSSKEGGETRATQVLGKGKPTNALAYPKGRQESKAGASPG